MNTHIHRLLQSGSNHICIWRCGGEGVGYVVKVGGVPCFCSFVSHLHMCTTTHTQMHTIPYADMLLRPPGDNQSRPEVKIIVSLAFVKKTWQDSGETWIRFDKVWCNRNNRVWALSNSLTRLSGLPRRPARPLSQDGCGYCVMLVLKQDEEAVKPHVWLFSARWLNFAITCWKILRPPNVICHTRQRMLSVRDIWSEAKVEYFRLLCPKPWFVASKVKCWCQSFPGYCLSK